MDPLKRLFIQTLLFSLQLAAFCAAPGPGYVDVVADFHANNMGEYDAAPAVREALVNLTQEGGGTLFFRPGKYFFSTQVVISGYGIKVVGSGAVSSACVNQGTTLFTDGANSSLLLFTGCTFCSVEDLSLSHSAACGFDGGSNSSGGVGGPSASSATCEAATAVAASTVQYNQQRRRAHKQLYTRSGNLRRQHEPAMPTLCASKDYATTQPTPTAGAAIEVSGWGMKQLIS